MAIEFLVEKEFVCLGAGIVSRSFAPYISQYSFVEWLDDQLQ